MPRWIELGTGSPLPIDLNKLRNFYGVRYHQDQTIPMSDLYRGGELVPNNSLNNGVPTSGSISLSNFYEKYALLQFDKHPPYLQSVQVGFQPTGTQYVEWVQNINSNQQGVFDVGYGGQKNSGNLQYRWQITGANNLSRIYASGNVLYPSTSNYYTPWYTGYGTLRLDRDWTSANQQYAYTGTVRCTVRKLWDGEEYWETSNSASWRLEKINSIE